MMLMLLPMIGWGQNSDSIRILDIPLGISDAEFAKRVLAKGGAEITSQPHYSNSREFRIEKDSAAYAYISIYYSLDEYHIVYLANLVDLKNAGVNALTVKYGKPSVEFDTNNRYEQVGRQYRHTEIYTDLVPKYVWYLPNARISYVSKYGCCFATEGKETWYESITYLDYNAFKQAFTNIIEDL